MKKVEYKEASPEILAQIDTAFSDASAPRASTPISCNRFALYPTEIGVTLILGGVMAGVRSDGKSIIGVNVAASVGIQKNFAEDLILAFRAVLGISDDDLVEAQKRNAHLYQDDQKT